MYQKSKSFQENRSDNSESQFVRLATFSDQRLSTEVQIAQQQKIRSAQLPQAIQLKAICQLAPTTINYGNLQEFKFNGKTGSVGSKMTAHLNPSDPRKGSDTSRSNAFASLFKELKPSTGLDWVRGHLLNHDLGGVAHYNNLFPITKGANNDHKYEVEYPVKHWLTAGCEIDYSVTAKKENTETTNADGVFECLATVTEGAPEYKGKKIQKNIHSKTQKIINEMRYAKKEPEVREGSVEVEYGANNNTWRDEYKAPGATKDWEHLPKSSEKNYFLYNNKRYPGEFADATTKLSGLITNLHSELKNLPLDRYSSDYEPAVKKAKESMDNLRSQWREAAIDVKKIFSSEILPLVENYVMKIQGRRPSQAVMLEEMGFAI